MTITVTLPPDIIKRLRDTGLTSDAAANLLGVGPKQAAHLLRKAGAKRDHRALGKWRMGAQ